MKKALKKDIAFFVILFALLTVLACSAFFIGCASSEEKEKRKFAEDAAKQVISEHLKSPDSAVWNEVSCLENNTRGQYIVYVDVKAQNLFGVYLRNKYFVLIGNINLKKNTFTYNRFTPYVECSGKDDKYSLELIKALNGYNGSGDKNNGDDDKNNGSNGENNGGNGEHKHKFINYIYNNDANCTNYGTETAKCEGCELTDTRKSVDHPPVAERHDYVDYICKYCGEIDPDAPDTDGLEFNEIADNGVVIGYSVSSGSASNRLYIKIPATHQGKPVIKIEENAFQGCNNLIYVDLPNGLISIGENAFFGCGNLIYIDLPDGLISIEKSAFQGCKNLIYVNLPDGLISIGQTAFFGCGELESIEIPSSVVSIGVSAFKDCNGLIQIQNGVQYVDKWVIGCDDSVESVTLRSGTVGIADRAFYSRHYLKNITITNSVVTVGEKAFFWCDKLTSIKIPSSVTEIGVGAFQGCSKLAIVEMSSSITSIEDDTFRDCSSLTSIEIPRSVTRIGSYAFSGCYVLSEIVLPESVNVIGEQAFAFCNALTIRCEAQSQPSGWAGNWNPTNRPVIWNCKDGTD